MNIINLFKVKSIKYPLHKILDLCLYLFNKSTILYSLYSFLIFLLSFYGYIMGFNDFRYTHPEQEHDPSIILYIYRNEQRIQSKLNFQ